MTVRELISILKEKPADLEVVVQSYEDGYDPVTDVDSIKVSPMQEKPWYSGVYEKRDDSDKAVVLIRSRYNRADTD